MRASMDTVTNLILIATCAAVVGLVAHKRFVPQVESAPAAFGKGEVVPSLTGVAYGDSAATLVLVESSQCTFCTRSMPFYRKLATQLASRSRVRMIAVSREPLDVTLKYLASHDVPVHKAIQLTGGFGGVSMTPTLVLVGRDGRAVASWGGMLSPEEETKALAAISLFL